MRCESRPYRYYLYLGMSGAPTHPQGIGQHGECDHRIDRPTWSHLGRKIGFLGLPRDCQAVVWRDYEEIYEIPNRRRIKPSIHVLST